MSDYDAEDEIGMLKDQMASLERQVADLREDMGHELLRLQMSVRELRDGKADYAPY